MVDEPIHVVAVAVVRVAAADDHGLAGLRADLGFLEVDLRRDVREGGSGEEVEEVVVRLGVGREEDAAEIAAEYADAFPEGPDPFGAD